MPDIVLATFNARYSHTAFGLRYLLANLGELQPRTELLEFDIQTRPLDAAEAILRRHPRLVGLGVHIWNVEPCRHLVALLKQLHPELPVILGGPEVSHETEQQEVCAQADYIVTGEADLAFGRVCRQLLDGERPASKIIAAPLPDLAQVALPYDLYADADLAHRVVYVEASRGCPFECEFCLSALDIPVRAFPLDRFLAAMDRLHARGCRQFKFVDRTFNLDLKTSTAILEFFRARLCPELFLHFEKIPDRFPAALRELVRKFPPGTLQFEVGIQTFNEEVAARISRRQDNAKAEANLRWLRAETGVHIHADLIVGLPGEDVASFATGFDRLVALQPHEIQVGILKRLHGTPIARHTDEWSMLYDSQAPYEILSNKLIDFPTMQRLKRFARFWDVVANSGRFVETTPRFWRQTTPFTGFMAFSDWLFAEVGRTHAIALPRLTELVAKYLVEQNADAPAAVAESLARDSRRLGNRQARHVSP